MQMGSQFLESLDVEKIIRSAQDCPSPSFSSLFRSFWAGRQSPLTLVSKSGSKRPAKQGIHIDVDD